MSVLKIFFLGPYEIEISSFVTNSHLLSVFISVHPWFGFFHPWRRHVKCGGVIRIFTVDFIVMKKICSVIFLGFAVISSAMADVEKHRAEETGKRYKEYKTFAGRVYTDVLVTKIDDAGIYLNHADGAARLRFEHLSPDQRKHFGITEAGATEIYAQELKAQAAHEAKVEVEQKAKRELLAKETAARIEAERLAAAKAPTPAPVEKKEIAPKIVSTIEIPTLPTVNGSGTGVIYSTRRYNPSRSAYYYNGGYAYPGGYSYYSPTYYPHTPPSGHCKPAHRGSIFHFTIK